MLSLSCVAVYAASALLTFAIASPDPLITPAPLLTRDAPKAGEVVGRRSAVSNYHPEATGVHRRDLLASCGYAYVDCGNGNCCSYGEQCYMSGTVPTCSFAADSFDINSILGSLTALLSGLPTDFDNFLTDVPTDTAGLSAYIASLTSVGLSGYNPTAPAANGQALHNGGSETSAKKGLSGGAIGGIVAGSVVAIATIVGLLTFFLVRRNRSRQTTPPPQPPSQMTQPGYPPQDPQALQPVYSQPAPPYPGIENGTFMQQQQKIDNNYYNQPAVPGAQEVQGDDKQRGIYVPPPAGQQQQWRQPPPTQTPHELAITPAPVQQQWQPAQPPPPMPASSGYDRPLYEMDTGLAK